MLNRMPRTCGVCAPDRPGAPGAGVRTPGLVDLARPVPPRPAALPRSSEALGRIADNIQRSQEALGRRLSIENPSHYLQLQGHDWDEIDFLAELVRRTGCGLLLDVNNVHVSAHNLGFDATDYLHSRPTP
jgi:hypothetical protein